jgi:hypothetical protein
MLLAKLYLNAEVYVNTNRYNDCIDYCRNIIDAGYSLDPSYRHLFLTTNHTSPEIIFPITFDGMRTRTWGGMTFLVHAPIGGSMNPVEFGVNGGWAGLRTTSAFVNLFADTTGVTDTRAMFHFDGQTREIGNVFVFGQGYPITKFRNVDANGTAGSDPEGNHIDTDFPMFRLADAYLMFAEAVLRGGTNGTKAEAISFVNQLRTRAYGGSTAGNVADISLPDILDERARELNWEGHRRTDLIRFGKFTGDSYIWPFKGGIKEGASVPDYLKLYPIPNSDIIANPNLDQNDGY